MPADTLMEIDAATNGLIQRPALRPEIRALRDAALAVTGWPSLPTAPILDAEAWQAHTEDEDWLIWRARRTANRLLNMPLELSSGERIVGRPALRPATEAEQARIAELRPVLESIPPYPGGDAGHFHPDFEKVFAVGFGGILDEVLRRQAAADDEDKRTFYEACAIALRGVQTYIGRVAELCEKGADETPEWAELGAMCRRLVSSPPASFHEAIQLMFLTEIALWFGEDHGLTTPGRMDQTLWRFYEADLAAGRITREEALELICCLFIQLNMILGSGSAISVMVGGRDAQGQDVTNELTYLVLQARLATQLVYPTIGVAWHEGTPDELMDFCCRMISTGVGDPALFNDELIVQALREHGVSEADSYNYMNSTCVEIKVVGASNMWVTAPYFNCPQALLQVMQGVAEGTVSAPESFEALNALVRDRLAETVRGGAEHLHRVWQARAQTACFPLASCVISDCLEKGLDFDRGGARYNWVENSFVGLANLADGLMAVRHLVYETGEYSLEQLHEILQADFAGHEALRQRILNSIPSYGNDLEQPDALAAEWAEFLADTTAANTVGLHPYVPGYFCWIMHERFGSETGATPDGRKAGWALADGAGAAQGREKSGPTASVLSTTRWSHRAALGGLVHNLKLSRKALSTEADMVALRAVMETYLRRGGFEIQVNVVGAEMLEHAREHPELYPDLLVRVAGYSDYFVRLNPNMQEEVIARSEHEGF